MWNPHTNLLVHLITSPKTANQLANACNTIPRMKAWSKQSPWERASPQMSYCSYYSMQKSEDRELKTTLHMHVMNSYSPTQVITMHELMYSPLEFLILAFYTVGSGLQYCQSASIHFTARLFESVVIYFTLISFQIIKVELPRTQSGKSVRKVLKNIAQDPSLQGKYLLDASQIKKHCNAFHNIVM